MTTSEKVVLFTLGKAVLDHLSKAGLETHFLNPGMLQLVNKKVVHEMFAVLHYNIVLVMSLLLHKVQDILPRKCRVKIYA